jgi:hypothetical protein
MSQQFSEKEQIAVIARMIETARNRARRGDGFLLMLWGYIIFIASFTQFALWQFFGIEEGYYAWWLIVVGIVASVWYRFKRSRERKTVTYTDSIVSYLWIGFSVCLISVGVFSYQFYDAALPVIMLFYGIGIFVTGGAYKFRPLIIGGIICWICAWIAFNVGDAWQLLLLSLSVLLGYIIPGHLVNRLANV